VPLTTPKEKNPGIPPDVLTKLKETGYAVVLKQIDHFLVSA
jgi:hypothetical protein